MKIKFTKLPTTDGTIKVSLDGGQSFTDYNIADIRESGIPLDDNQDYEKIQIQAGANILKNLNVVLGVKVEGTGSTNEPFLIIDTDTYGFEFPNCVTGVVLPNGMTIIGNYAGKSLFYGYPNLQTIIIPESVTSIGNNAFSGCKGLTSITIPESVTSIGASAFYNCSSLKTINYTGTEEQWNAISKGTDWKYGCPSDMTLNLNYQN